ncbi:2Fe-2S iron-sulfur cluster-binding protein [Paracoccaceae bacterium]|nr:2Fe-2S iron-sulfur cluster-binding protein [Paracoccaceae bacterium]
MSSRLPQEGSRINREKTVDFRFNGKNLKGFYGDTVASALLANNEMLVARSFKYHRPRGIFSAGEEEPNALMGIGEGPFFEPNIRATEVKLKQNMNVASQNHWPSLRFDFLSINNVFSRFFAAGFYYKTFMWPRAAWKYLFEPMIRRASGLGNAPRDYDEEHYEHIYHHTDVLIIGGGLAGITAAKALRDRGLSIMVCEKDCVIGGRYLEDSKIEEKDRYKRFHEKNIGILKKSKDISVKLNTTVTGIFDHGFVLAYEENQHSNTTTKKVLWKIRAKTMILCTGAIERPIIFPDNDLPGIMLAASVRDYLQKYGVLLGDRLVLTTNNDYAYKTVIELKHRGIDIPVVLDARASSENPIIKEAEGLGIRILFGKCIGKVEGKRKASAIGICSVNGEGTIEELIPCNAIAVSGGWTPNVNLWSHCGGKLLWDGECGFYKPDPENTPTGREGETNMLALGACAGVFSNYEIQDQVPRKINQLASRLKIKSKRYIETNVFSKEPEKKTKPAFTLPHGASKDKQKRMYIDFQNDVKVSDLQLAVQEGFENVEHAKRYTTLGMATDQGKTSNINGIHVLSQSLGKPVDKIGHTTFRPPYKPVPLGLIAGQYAKKLFKPVRKTPIDKWNLLNNAIWEPVADWRRAYAYPKSNEELEETLGREVLSVRKNVGLLDSSTLGKILVKGPDAGRFLDLIYTNMISTLKAGKCRYGLMCNEAGFVFDDGVVARLNDQSFICHTTSGGADRVYAWLEEWLQTEWHHLKVFIVNLTEQYSQIAVAGPKSRELLQTFKSIDLSSEKLPFMNFIETNIDDIWVRIYRISFSGELSYELAVNSNQAEELWNKLVKVGKKYKVQPYGTEALHILRAEKGFIVVGDETDGTVTPHDLGMEWIVSKKKKDFIGKKAFSLPHLNSSIRKQLVGILTLDTDKVLPDGCHAVEDGKAIGHVTSTYFSPTLKRSIALGLIESGRSRKGSTLEFEISSKESIFAKIVDPNFYDPEGAKQDG